jgi:hypothetical protein
MSVANLTNPSNNSNIYCENLNAENIVCSNLTATVIDFFNLTTDTLTTNQIIFPTEPAFINGTGIDNTTATALMWNYNNNTVSTRDDVITYGGTQTMINKGIDTSLNTITIGGTNITSLVNQDVRSTATPSFNSLIIKNGGTNKTTLTSAASSTTSQAIFPEGIGYVVLRDLLMTLTNKNFVDNSTYVVGLGDVSKRFQLIADLAGTGTTTQLIANSTSSRTINLPNASTTLLGNNNTDVITNKTIAYGSNTITGLPISSSGYAAYYVLNNTSISNVIDTIIPFDTSLATDSGISNSSGTFTINTAGVYTIVATVGYLLNAAGFRRSYIMLNSSTVQYGQNRILGNSTIDVFMVSSFTAKLSAGDTIKVMTLQSSGGSATLIGYNGFAGSSMTMVQFTRIS